MTDQQDRFSLITYRLGEKLEPTFDTYDAAMERIWSDHSFRSAFSVELRESDVPILSNYKNDGVPSLLDAAATWAKEKGYYD